MIRRETTIGDRSYWWLTAQVEHARLSGELAAAWGNERIAPIIGPIDNSGDDTLAAVRQEVLAAIKHHDDGWRAWDAAPRIDRQHQRPYSFLEMPLADSLAIWQESIERSAQIGPLAAWMVASHFIELRSGSETQSLAASRWVDDMLVRRQEWLAAWQALDRAGHTNLLAQEALAWLRSFDVLSLWLCSGPTDVLALPLSAEFDLPVREPIRFTPQDSARPDELQVISVDPWPFSSSTLSLATESMMTPVDNYIAASVCLAAGSRQPLEWRFQPTPTHFGPRETLR